MCEFSYRDSPSKCWTHVCSYVVFISTYNSWLFLFSISHIYSQYRFHRFPVSSISSMFVLLSFFFSVSWHNVVPFVLICFKYASFLLLLNLWFRWWTRACCFLFVNIYLPCCLSLNCLLLWCLFMIDSDRFRIELFYKCW